MAFTNHFFFWAFLALLIPIVVHLFVFRKTRKLYFSNISFINAVKDETKSRTRLQHLLILVSRLLLFIFLIIAFLGPVNDLRKGNTQHSVIYIDNSFSLSGEVSPGISGLNEILGLVNVYVEKQALDHKFILLTNNFDAFSNSYRTKREVLDYLTELDFSPKARKIENVFDRLNRFSDDRPNYFVFTDFQETTFKAATNMSWDDLSGQVNFIKIEHINANNVFVDSAYLFSPFNQLGTKNTLTFNLRSSGAGKRKDLTAKLLNGSKLMGSQNIEMNPNTSRQIDFELDLQVLRSNRLTLSFEDFPVTFDNEYYLSIPTASKIDVALVSNQTNTYIDNVFGNTELFSLERFNTKSIDFSRMGNFDLLIVEGFQVLPDWLNGVMNELGSVIVIPSLAAIDSKSYSDFFQLSMQVSQDTSYHKLRFLNTQHPILQDFGIDISNNVTLPNSRRTIEYRPTVNTIFGNEFGEPYLSVFNLNTKVFLFGSPLSLNYSELSQHAVFLPLMYKIAQESKSDLGVYWHNIDDDLFAMEMTTKGNFENVEVSGASGQFIPNNYWSNGNLILELPPNGINSGFHFVTSGTDTLGVLPINESRFESEFKTLSEEAIESLLKSSENIAVINSSSSLELDNSFESMIIDEAYWKYALILALFFAFIEVVLVRIANKQKRAK